MVEKSLRPSPTALLNPCADPVFKALFTQESEYSRKALKGFLSSVLQKEISDIELQPNELGVETGYDRQTQFDLTCIADGEPINVEMQGVNIDSCFSWRAEYHVAHLLNHYCLRGSNATDAPKVYQISVLNFVHDKNILDTVSHYVMRTKDGHILGERMNVYFIELPKIKKLPDNPEKLTNAEMWGKFFLNASDSSKSDFVKNVLGKDEGIGSAMTELEFLSEDNIQWHREWSHEKYLEFVNDQVNAGRRLGVQQGIQQGILESAVKMIKEFNLPVEAVCEKLSVDKELLLEELNKMN